MTTLGDTQALPRVIDVDPGDPAPVTMALPTAALRLRPVMSLVPASETDQFPLVGDPADEAPELLEDAAEDHADADHADADHADADHADVEYGDAEYDDGGFDEARCDDADGDRIEPAGAASAPPLVVVPHERIYAEAMASIAALAQNWNAAVDDLHGGGAHRSAA